MSYIGEKEKEVTKKYLNYISAASHGKSLRKVEKLRTQVINSIYETRIAIQGTPAFREGKVVRVQQWLATRGLKLDDFARSHFYSDSTNDLPLLECVSDPVATNPGPALERIAVVRGWPVLKLFT